MINIIESESIKTIMKTSLKVSFEYNENIINVIRNIEGAIWNKKELFWEVPLNKLSDLIDSLVYLDDINIKLLDDEEIEEKPLLSKKEWLSSPFEYQEEGIKWLVKNKNSLLLDEPGLGKSLEIIYVAEELKERENVEHCLIICGINTLKQNWKKEVQKHSNLDCRIIGEKINSKGRSTYTSIKERAEELYNKLNEFFIILNVESLRDNLVIDAIRNSENKFDMIVFDEVHTVKNPNSAQGKNLLKLAKIGKYHYGLTGTVLINSPLDVYVPLKFIGEEKGTYTNFKQMYCNYEQKFGHNQIVGFKNLDILKEQLANCSLRRKKDLLNLPPKVIVPEYIEMDKDHEKFYDNIQNGVVEEADRVNIKTTSLLGLVTRLRQAATCPSILTSQTFINNKLDRAISLVGEITSNNEKVVIFSMFKEPLNILYENLIQYKPLLCTGDIGDEIINKNIEIFQTDDEHKVMLCTIQKMGTGITLTKASYEIFIDCPWTNAEFQQACDRCYRIGTTKTVIVYNLIMKNTIDERVQYLLEFKSNLSDYMVDNQLIDDDRIRYLLGLNKMA